MSLRLTITLCLFVLGLTKPVHAQVPQIINYQGRVAVGGTNFDGTAQFKVALVNGAGSQTFWSNGVNAVTSPVTKGLYSILLGDTSVANMAALPSTVFTNTDVRLRVWFAPQGQALQQLTPDSRVAAAGYALMAANTEQLDGQHGAFYQNATNLTGTVADARLSTNVALLNASQAFTGSNRFANVVTATNVANTFVGAFTGNGSGLTNLDAADLSGTVALARLPSVLVTNNATGLTLGGTFTGNGAGVTNVNLYVNSQGALTLRANWGNFLLASSPSIGTGPYSVTTADVNGDGKRDLITANADANTLSVLANNGSGGFTLISSPAVGTYPQSVVAADVNGDGKVDLISANSYDDTLCVLTNNGSGGFSLASSPGVGRYPQAVVAADVNGDGKVDLISANGSGNTLSVLANNGSGGFALISSPPVGAEPRSVAAADVNGDGKIDLISANLSGNTLSVLANNGSGGFTLLSSPSVGNLPETVAAADVNGDGKVDLVCASGDYTLSVLTNNGSGVFTLASTQARGRGARSVAATDANGDGVMDLIDVNSRSNTLSVLVNNGSGVFSVASILAVGTSPRLAVAADINGDGGADLICANDGGTLSVLTNSVADYQTVFTGSGSGLTDLNASKLTRGTVPLEQLPATVITDNSTDVTLGGTFAGDGSGVTNLNASQLTSGTVPLARLPVSVVTNNATGITLGGMFTGNGSGVTNLNASQLTSGTVPLARLPVSVVTNNAIGVTLGGTFTGNGVGLTNLDATDLTGTLADARLSTNVALRNVGQTFSGTNTFTAANTFTATNRFTGLIRSGSETGTDEAPNPAGVVIRPINSSVMTAGTVVATAQANGTSEITLERDGTPGGWQFRLPPGLTGASFSVLGFDVVGSARNLHYSMPNGGGGRIQPLYLDGHDIVYLQGTFGIIGVPGGHHTQVTLSRYNQNSTNWVGTVISTWNQ